MKVLQILPRIANQSSGPSYSVPKLCEALSNQGWDVELGVLEPRPDHAPSCKTLFFPVNRYPGAHRLGASKAMRTYLKKHMKDYDIVHNNSLWMMPNIYPGRFLSAHHGPKLVVSPRGTLQPWALARSATRKRIMWRIGQKKLLERASMFHATASTEYESIRAKGLLQPVAVVPNGIEILPQNRAGKHEENRRTLLFLSRIHPVKRVRELVESWSRVMEGFEEWQLIIAGPIDSVYARQVDDLIQNMRIRRVKMVGEVSGDDKNEALSNADLFVLPTHSENFGIAIAEALAAGLPVITTRGAPWSGLVSHKCGWWITKDLHDLDETLKAAMNLRDDERAEMGRRGRRWMHSEFSWQQCGEKMSHAYRWLAGNAEQPEWLIID